MQDGSMEVTHKEDVGSDSKLVIGLWNDVIGTVNGILEVNRDFGFVKFESMINPSLTVILHSLSLIEAAINSVMDSEHIQDGEYRQGINAKQCILHIRQLAVALRDKNQDEYDRVIRTLEKQPQI